MFLNVIDTAGAERLGPSLQKDLAMLAASLDSRFVEAGGTLAAAVETIDRVIRAVDDVTSALDERAAGAAVRSLAAVAARLATLPGTQAVRDGELSTVATTTSALHDQVMEMHQVLNVLRIYGVNIKIVASGAEEFVGFVDGMSATLGASGQELDAFLVTLKDLGASVMCARQGERVVAAECVKVVPAVPRRLADDAAELEAYLATIAAAARQVGAIARDIQGRVAIVLGALQVGDSTRQRLEHVVSALQILDRRPGADDEDAAADQAVVSHVYRLLAAQLAAIGTDFDREATLLLASLAGLGPDTQRLLALIEDDVGEDGRTVLHRLEKGINEVEQLTSQLHEADHRSGLMVDTIATALEVLAAKLDNLRRMRIDIQSIAVNTRLMCRRSGNIGKAVSVIASEVDLYAGRLGSALDQIVRPIQDIRETSLSMRAAQRSAGSLDAGQALSEALCTIREGCRRTECGIGAGRDDARQVIAMIEATSGKLAGELALGDTIRQAGADLSAVAGRDIPLPEAADLPLRNLLMTIAGLYTMAQERQIHAAFLPPGTESVAAAAPIGEDSLGDDDGLF